MLEAVSVIIPAYKRVSCLLDTIGRIQKCRPLPSEIIVHVDGGVEQTREAVLAHFPEVKIILSKENIGPGGGRNKLIQAAENEFVASFDDDSYPTQRDYFSRLVQVFKEYTDAAVLFASVSERNADAPVFSASEPIYCKQFVGCACAYRRSKFLELPGYVPLAFAYGCEESDLALQLSSVEMKVLYHPDLQVFHDTEMLHHASKRVNAASVKNLALLAYLRYPVFLWPYGFLQVVNRVYYLLKMKRYKGLLSGLFGIPLHCFRYRQYRSVLKLNRRS